MKLSEGISLFLAARGLRLSEHAIRGYTSHLMYFCLFWRDPDLQDLTEHHIIEYLTWNRTLGWSPGTVVARGVAIKSLLNYLDRKALLSFNPALVEIPSKKVNQPQGITEASFRHLLNSIPRQGVTNKRDRAILQLLWDTGARTGELCSLTQDDLKGEMQVGDTTLYRAVINTEKSRGVRPLREIFWLPETQNALAAWLASRRQIDKGKHIFVASTGRPLDSQAVWVRIKNHAKRIGLPPVKLHSFRHHRARQIIENGGSSADVANVLGHSSVASTTIYTMVSDRQLAYRVVATFHASKKGVSSSHAQQKTFKRDPQTSRSPIMGSTEEKIWQFPDERNGDKRRKSAPGESKS